MHIHILGICGTFMGGIALLGRELGFRVSGSDANVYPPMSTQLASQGIVLTEGYHPSTLDPAPDCVLIGNALSRGNAAVEYVLERGIPYMSGAEFLAQHILRDRWVLAVAGTHGKTTTSSMLAWILEYAGLKPGYLIGGVPENFGASARLGESPFFVVEADEYDTAFFDKRSKFVHYKPRTVIINNIEFDHADIFPDLSAIQRQFHHLVRTVPRNGLILVPAGDANIEFVLKQGCWTPIERYSSAGNQGYEQIWTSANMSPDGHRFDVLWNESRIDTVEWSLIGQHNVHNALAAIAAARHAGVLPEQAIKALHSFRSVKRRMELIASINGVNIYDDFAHHPTAILTTLQGLRNRVGKERIIAVVDPRSNTMRMGVHKDALAPSLMLADAVFLHQPADIRWNLEDVAHQIGSRARVFDQVPAIVDAVVNYVRRGDHVVIMSNGGFGGIHQLLQKALA